MSTITGAGSGSSGVLLPDSGVPPVDTPVSGAPTQGTQNTQPTTPQSPPPQLFNLSFTGQATAVLLGLVKPRGNFGDVEALFAQVAAVLKKVQAETDDNDEFARSSERLSTSSRAATALQQLVQLNGQIATNEAIILDRQLRIEVIDEELVPLRQRQGELEADIALLQDRIMTIDGEISTLNGQIDTLGTVIQSLTNSINGLNSQIGTLDSEIDQLSRDIGNLDTQITGYDTTMQSLTTQIGQLQTQLSTTTDPALRATLQTTITNLQNQHTAAFNARSEAVTERAEKTLERNGKIDERANKVTERGALETTRSTRITERDQKVTQRDNLVSERDTLQDRLIEFETELNAVLDQIDALETERAGAVAEIEAREAQIPGLVASMVAVVTGAYVFTQAVQALMKGDFTRDSFDTRDYSDPFEAVLGQILADVIRAVEGKVDQEFLLENAQIGLGDWRFEQGSGIAARFGAMQPAQTLALGMASAVAAILGTLRELLDKIDSIPQSPTAIAETGQSRMRVAL